MLNHRRSEVISSKIPIMFVKQNVGVFVFIVRHSQMVTEFS